MLSPTTPNASPSPPQNRAGGAGLGCVSRANKSFSVSFCLPESCRVSHALATLAPRLKKRYKSSLRRNRKCLIMAQVSQDQFPAAALGGFFFFYKCRRQKGCRRAALEESETRSRAGLLHRNPTTKSKLWLCLYLHKGGSTHLRARPQPRGTHQGFLLLPQPLVVLHHLLLLLVQDLPHLQPLQLPQLLRFLPAAGTEEIFLLAHGARGDGGLSSQSPPGLSTGAGARCAHAKPCTRPLPP